MKNQSKPKPPKDAAAEESLSDANEDNDEDPIFEPQGSDEESDDEGDYEVTGKELEKEVSLLLACYRYCTDLWPLAGSNCW